MIAMAGSASTDQGATNVTRNRRAGWFAGVSIAVVFLALAWLTLGHYGITWDEPENFLSGDLYLRFFATGDRTWLDFEKLKNDWALSPQRPFFYVYTFARQERYPPAANLVSAFAGWTLHERLGWLDPIIAHHVPIPMFGALGVLAVFLFAWQGRGGKLAPALIAGLSLATFPLYWGQSHNNVKDVPAAALFAIALWAAWRAFGDQRTVQAKWVVATGIAWGLGLGTKANAIVIAPVLVTWLGSMEIWPAFRSWRRSRSWLQLCAGVGCALLLATVVMVAAWPYLWADPLRRLYGVFRYFSEVGKGYRVFFEGQMYSAGQTLPWRYALTHLLLTTPLVVLGLAALGFIRAIRESWRGESSVSLLWLIWFCATLVRVSLPGMVIYNGLRQIMELLPALCLLAGLGGEWLWEWLGYLWRADTQVCPYCWKGPRWRWAQNCVAVVLVAFLVVPQAMTLIRLHPYEGAFFNVLAGGERGADQRYTLEYWGQSYQEGATWLNQNASPYAWVAVPIAGHLARFYLRPDLQLITENQVNDLSGMTGEGYVMFMRDRDWYGGPAALPDYMEAREKPIHEVRAGAAAILSIYRWPGAS